ncbi:hypothetical protein DFH09DRAFT_893756, partial [Mycena vulgaris]
FYDPPAQGGAMLNNAVPGGGEPLNVIIFGHTTPSVLTTAGFLGFAGALGFFVQNNYRSSGDPQAANLGDGHSWVNQTTELRQDYGSAPLGTCWESLVGGDHLRVYKQDGSSANSGALFL